MADQELPLVDVWALASTQRSGTKLGYSVTFQVGQGEESRRRTDQKQMDAFLRGKNGDKPVRLILLEVPPDWSASEADPEQGEDTELPVAKLQDSWDALRDLMTTG